MLFTRFSKFFRLHGTQHTDTEHFSIKYKSVTLWLEPVRYDSEFTEITTICSN